MKKNAFFKAAGDLSPLFPSLKNKKAKKQKTPVFPLKMRHKSLKSSKLDGRF
jgi:hypothetical protein